MLCEIHTVTGNFFLTFFAMFLMGSALTLCLSGVVFYFYYWKSNVTYEKWTRKTNPEFPAPEKVRDEIVQMFKGLAVALICPTLSLWLSARGLSNTYCGVGEYGWSHIIVSFFMIWIVSDFWEFAYHRMGHSFKFFWNIHKHHHVFYNPSPFAVIADEYVDQFVRSAPLVLFPLFMPLNIDLLFIEFSLFFYFYGVYLHFGYEFDSLDAHHPIINTAFQHNCHHSHAIMNKPYHCGFFFKIWDQLSGGIYDGKCFCAKCSRNAGLRSRELFEKVELHDYSVLLQPSFWLSHRAAKEASDQYSPKLE